MNNVTTLKHPKGTFSHIAYTHSNTLFGTPEVLLDGPEANHIPAESNGNILPTIIKYGGFGIVPVRTLIRGNVAESIDSFRKPMLAYESSALCPFHIIGAIEMRIRFCLMARKGMTMDSIKGVIGHEQAISACQERIASARLSIETVGGNGEAAWRVSNNEQYANHAALGPSVSAEENNLVILNDTYEDSEAITTFFIIEPKEHTVPSEKKNRTLVVLQGANRPNMLAQVLTLFGRKKLNLTYVHSIYAGNNSYDFVLEIEVPQRQIEVMRTAMNQLPKYVQKHIAFGPFPVVSM